MTEPEREAEGPPPYGKSIFRIWHEPHLQLEAVAPIAMGAA